MGIIDSKKDIVVFVQTKKGTAHKYYGAYFSYNKQNPNVVEIRDYMNNRLFAVYPMDSIYFIADVLPETNEHDVRV